MYPVNIMLHTMYCVNIMLHSMYLARIMLHNMYTANIMLHKTGTAERNNCQWWQESDGTEYAIHTGHKLSAFWETGEDFFTYT